MNRDFEPRHHSEHEGKTDLVFIVNGFMGSPGAMINVERSIHEVLDDKGLVQFSNSNIGLLETSKGVDVGGRRLADEVRSFVSQRKDLRSISFVASSLGGLYVRYALSLLFDKSDGTIAGLKPRIFCTLATPHLGSRLSTFEDAFLGLVRKIASTFSDTIGRTLDQTSRTDTPGNLLMQLTTDEFLAPLAAFERRVLFANRVNDNRCIYESAAIWPHWRHDEENIPDDEIAEIWSAEGNSAEVKKAFSAVVAAPASTRLDEDQVAMAQALRGMSWTVVDTHYDGILAMSLAHVHIQGRYVNFTPYCRSVFGFLLSEPLAHWLCDIPGTDSLDELGNIFK